MALEVNWGEAIKNSKLIISSLGALLLFFLLSFQNCSDVSFNQSNDNRDSLVADSNSNSQDPNDTGSEPPFCDDPSFVNQTELIECLALMDTFDRDSVIGSSQFNWTSIIDDRVRTDNNNVQANIFTEGEFGFGAAAHENHAVYVTGRRGGSVHEVFFISVPLDLTIFEQMRISFKYLPIGLENSGMGAEHVRLDICAQLEADCGLDETMSDGDRQNALRSNAWQTIFEQPGFSSGTMSEIERGVNNNGRNHTASSWLSGEATVNLNTAVADKSKVVFRISVLMDEGFYDKNSDGSPDFNSDIDDAIGIDHVRVYATKRR